MKTIERALTFSIFRKALILTILCLGCGLFLTEETVQARSSACYDAYEACHNDCDTNPVYTTPQAKEQCHSTCLSPYGQCVNLAEMNKEGEIVGDYEEGQPMPVLNEFRMCIQACGSCRIVDYLPNDPEGLDACLESYYGCKSACIDQF